jgi:hypothetical protein
MALDRSAHRRLCITTEPRTIRSRPPALVSVDATL